MYKRMVELRSLESDDLRSASELCMQAKAHWGYDAAFLAACVPALQLKETDLSEGAVTGAFDRDMLIGVIHIMFDDENCLLDKLFVDPAWMYCGVGRKLFEWCQQEACKRDMAKVVIESDPFAEPFYIAMGCRKVGHTRCNSTERMLPLLELILSGLNRGGDDG